MSSQACPDCAVELPVSPGYLTWCHACGWNIVAPTRDLPRGRVDRLYAVTAKRLDQRLVTKLTTADALRPRLTVARGAAFGVAALVHALSLGFALLGVLLVILAFPNPFAIVLGLVLIGLAVIMRPRVGKVPKSGVLQRSAAPGLYRLTDEVAAALGTRPADMIVVDTDFSASWSVRGLRRRRVLELGLPLLAVLEPQERVALIGHELAHGRNGDSTRGLVVGSAVGALSELSYALTPQDSGDDWALAAIAGAFMWVLSRPFYGLLWLEVHLLLRDSQRAEYLADALAADVAGTATVVGLHEKLFLESIVTGVLQQRTVGGSDPGGTDLLAEIGTRANDAPPRERERRRRVAQLEDARLYATHPPTARRIEFLEQRSALQGKVVLTADRAAAIERELEPARKRLAPRLLDLHRASLYIRYR